MREKMKFVLDEVRDQNNNADKVCFVAKQLMIKNVKNKSESMQAKTLDFEKYLKYKFPAIYK